MAQKKETSRTTKPGVKMQDLAPKKDAKGGGGGKNAATGGTFTASGGGKNTATGGGTTSAN